jgi:hypothetical protein
MENKLQKSAGLERISRGELSTAIKAKRFDEASALLPTKIEEVINQPKVFELIRTAGTISVQLQIEYELIQAAALTSVGGNLTTMQVKFISAQLINKYPNESIADFKLCLSNGMTHQYGDIYRLDPVIIFGWMEKYLEEKYRVFEEILYKEKENPYQVNSEPNEKAKQWAAKWLNSIKDAPVAPRSVNSIDEKSVRLEGKERPLKRQHKQPANYGNQLVVNIIAAEYYKQKPYDYTKLSTFQVDGLLITALNLEEARDIFTNYINFKEEQKNKRK